MKNAGKQFAGNFIHVGNHQQKTLGSGISACQGTSRKHSMYRARGSGFGLHFPHYDLLAKNVFRALYAKLVHDFRHGRRRRNGVNGSCFG